MASFPPSTWMTVVVSLPLPHRINQRKPTKQASCRRLVVFRNFDEQQDKYGGCF